MGVLINWNIGERPKISATRLVSSAGIYVATFFPENATSLTANDRQLHNADYLELTAKYCNAWKEAT